MNKQVSIKYLYRDNKLVVIPCTALNNAESRMIDWLASPFHDSHVSITPKSINPNTIAFLVYNQPAYADLMHGINAALFSARIHNPNDYITTLSQQMRVIMYHDFSGCDSTIPDAMCVWNDAVARMFSIDNSPLDIASVSKTGKQRSYAFQCGKRAAQNYIKRKQRVHAKNDELVQDFDCADISDNITIAMVIDSCKLSETDKLLLERYYAGMTQAELAKVMNISQPAIHKRLRKCADALRETVTISTQPAQPAQPAPVEYLQPAQHKPAVCWTETQPESVREYQLLQSWLATPFHDDNHVSIAYGVMIRG